MSDEIPTAKIIVDATMLKRLADTYLKYFDAGLLPNERDAGRASFEALDLLEEIGQQLWHPAPVGYPHGFTMHEKPKGERPLFCVAFEGHEWKNSKYGVMETLNEALRGQDDAPEFYDLADYIEQNDTRGFWLRVEHRAQEYGFDTYRRPEGLAVYKRGTELAARAKAQSLAAIPATATKPPIVPPRP